ncbi:MAG: beta-N-acetylhexosaminidase [Nitrospirae bacterium]|nr:MAG: beta-N-acetylhexosaminidase [Nitrospirota bacterium]
MNFYQFIIPRLNGKDIEKDFDYYLGLVKKGVAGFIIFGGKLGIVRQGISELQKEAERPLIIASDLERGLGQQLEGGTIFPPAMAIAAAFKKRSAFSVQRSALKLLRDTFKAVAVEAGYAGINTIFAPVLDINTNPKNPIISTRAFGGDAKTVSFFGIEMIKAFQANGIVACGKHFPGHGDTEIDSHIGLPLIKKDIQSLEKTELVTFSRAVKAGVEMIMLGHLKVPALDPSGIPVSLSEKAVRYLRDRMGFKGILITDALNMGGINWGNSSKSSRIEERASLMALRAGVDLLLHPTDTERVVSYLEKKLSAFSPFASGESARGGQLSANTFRKSLRLATGKIKTPAAPDFGKNRRLSEKITNMAIKIDGQIRPLKKSFLIILNDAKDKKGNPLISALRPRHRNLKYLRVNAGDDIHLSSLNDREMIVAVFSGIKAWKGGPSPWLLKCIKELEGKAGIFISFGSPYILDAIRKDCTKIYAWWDSDSAQKAVAEVL